MDKQSIVSVARTLFYDQGINNVSVKQLAENCEIAPSLITYYFKSKSNIVTSVISQYSKEIDSLITEKFYEKRIPFDIRVVSIVELLVKLGVYEKDEKARLFYLEYLNCGMETLFSAGFQGIYRQLDQHIILDIDRSYDELSLVASAAHGAVLVLIYAYYTARLNCTYEQFVDYVLNARCKIMNISAREAEIMINEGKRCYHSFDFKIKPYFVVE